LAAPNGIAKSVWSVLKTSSLMLREFAAKFLPNAKYSIKLKEYAKAATKAMLYIMAHAKYLRIIPILAVYPGTETTFA
jgi:hypothetical protein